MRNHMTGDKKKVSLECNNQGTTESSKKQKLFLMNWCPDSAKIKKKMLYASSFDNLKKALVGVHKFIQVRNNLTRRTSYQLSPRPLMPLRRPRARWKSSWEPPTGFKTSSRSNKNSPRCERLWARVLVAGGVSLLFSPKASILQSGYPSNMYSNLRISNCIHFPISYY